VIEQQPLQEGRNMSMLLAPSREAVRASQAERAAKAEAAAAPQEGEPSSAEKPEAA
jgi:hypothetical protein